MRVFVTNYGGHDYTNAKKYGELTPITKGYVSQGSLDRTKYNVVEGMKDAGPEDWLLLSGTPLIGVIAALAWMAKHKRIKMLVHDKKRDGHYRELIVSESNFLEMLSVING